MKLPLLSLAWAASVLGGHLHAIFDTPGRGISIGVIDPSSGMADLVPLQLPATECEPGWTLLADEQVQSQTVLYENSTAYFLAKEVCDGDVRNLTMFTVNPSALAYPLAKLDVDIVDPRLAWDFVCNVILSHKVSTRKSARTVGDNLTLSAGEEHYAFSMISAYDGQNRPLLDQGSADPNCNECWRRTSGSILGIDGRGWVLPKPNQTGVTDDDNDFDDGEEEGDPAQCYGCVSYAMETYFHNYQATWPRQLVGRGLNNATVVSNVTDGTQLLTFEFLPDGGFVGIGVCCELVWCANPCEGHGGKLSVVGWSDRRYPPEVLYILDEVYDQSGAGGEAALGVALDYRFPLQVDDEDGQRVTLLANNKIYSFIVSFADRVPKAELLEVSPAQTTKPALWWYSSF